MQQEQTKEHRSKGRKYMSVFMSFILTAGGLAVGAVGFAAAVVAFLPRVQIDAMEQFDPESPFPNSISITNIGNIRLEQVSVFMRPRRVASKGGGTIIGSSSSGGVTTPDWQGHRLATGEKWTIPMGRNVAFQFGPITNGDILIVVTYWPWLVPKPSFINLRETAARLITHRQPNGQVIWIARPND